MNGLDYFKKLKIEIDNIPKKIVTDVTETIDVKKLKEKLDEENEKELSRRFIP